jgi:DNA-binding GntR family transcriptional regulator
MLTSLMSSTVNPIENITAAHMPLSDHIVNLLRDRIVMRMPGYRPGERLNSQTIADELGISRTPVTYAIRQLREQNLVIVKPRKGSFVCEQSPGEVRDLFELAGRLEALALRLADWHISPDSLALLRELVDAGEEAYRRGDGPAYLQADSDFHHVIGNLSPNIKLREVYQSVKRQSNLATAFQFSIPQNLQASVEEHRRLVDVLAQGDPSRSEAEIMEHWQRGFVRYCQVHQDTKV